MVKKPAKQKQINKAHCYRPATNLTGKVNSLERDKEAKKELTLGVLYQKNKQYSKATNHYSKSIHLNPKS